MQRIDPIDDTIAAVSTPAGRGAIGVIRISGPATKDLLARFFQPAARLSGLESHRVRLGKLVEPDSGQTVDQVLTTYFQAPKSFTGQDMAEISFHGSPVLAAQIMELLLAGGARLANPGEFTCRAHLAGKLDLPQAEAIRDLIDSKTRLQARLAEQQLAGGLAKLLRPLKEKLLDLLCRLETGLEFPELENEHPPDRESAARQLAAIRQPLEELSRHFRLGRLVQDGFSLVIAGRPNTGKSTLFNRLLGEDRAIVTGLPGTTRDTLREMAQLDGIPVIFTDTAGLREPEDLVERLGVDRSRAALSTADVILYLLDAGHLPEAEEFDLIHQLPEVVIVVINKIDGPVVLSRGRLLQSVPARPVAEVSALCGQGIDELRAMIRRMISPPEEQPDGCRLLVTGLRQQDCLRRCLEEIRAAESSLGRQESEEFILYHLRRLLNTMGEVTGETGTADILNRIFSTFCIGK